MIVLLTTAAHSYTHESIEPEFSGFRRRSYDWLFARAHLPVATYIFTDLDRLDTWDLEIAAGLYRQLDAAGCRVLNDPARALMRLPLLQRLHTLGFNRFNAWAAQDATAVDRFPVFVRTARAHRGVLSEPLHDAQALSQKIEALIVRGFPVSDLIVIEYCAQPVRAGLYRKPSVYRVGDCTIAVPSVHQDQWAVNLGNAGIATDDEYARDLQIVVDNPFGAVAHRAFDAAQLSYGRADVGEVDAGPQIYEINTNPMMPPNLVQHHSSLRVEAFRLSTKMYLEALAEIDTGLSRHRIAVLPTATRTWAKRALRWSLARPWIKRRYVLNRP